MGHITQRLGLIQILGLLILLFCVLWVVFYPVIIHIHSLTPSQARTSYIPCLTIALQGVYALYIFTGLPIGVWGCKGVDYRMCAHEVIKQDSMGMGYSLRGVWGERSGDGRLVQNIFHTSNSSVDNLLAYKLSGVRVDGLARPVQPSIGIGPPLRGVWWHGGLNGDLRGMGIRREARRYAIIGLSTIALERARLSVSDKLGRLGTRRNRDYQPTADCPAQTCGSSFQKNQRRFGGGERLGILSRLTFFAPCVKGGVNNG